MGLEKGIYYRKTLDSISVGNNVAGIRSQSKTVLRNSIFIGKFDEEMPCELIDDRGIRASSLFLRESKTMRRIRV